MILEEFKSGILYTTIGKYSNAIIQLLVNIVLSRLLTPNDYGIVAIVQVFLVFFNMIGNMGMGPAIIQIKNLNREDIQVLFKFSLILASILAVVFALLGYPASLFYSNFDFIQIFLVLGIAVFFQSSYVIPQSILLKDKDFKRVSNVEIISNIVQGVVSILLGFLEFRYYSIIIATIFQAIVRYVYYYKYTKISLNTKMNKKSIQKISSFARNQFFFNFLNYFSRNLDSLLIGRYIGSSALGFYNKSYQVTLYPNQLLTGVITGVIQPIMSNYEDNPAFIKNVFLKISRILATIGIPLSVFCFLNAENIIYFLFGNQWSGSILSFKILSVSIWAQMISSSTGAIYQSANRTDLLLFSGIQSTLFNVISIIIGIMMGSINYVALMIVISFHLNLLVNNYLLMYTVFKSNFKELLKTLMGPIKMGIIQFLFLFFIPNLELSIFGTLIVEGIMFSIAFIVGLFLTNQISDIKYLLKKS